MRRYPRSERKNLLGERQTVSEHERRIARQFGPEYFDGERRLGLGGYYYNPRFFAPVVQDMISHYQLEEQAAILDVGCGKGFMLKDFRDALPHATLKGLDISSYCLENAHPDVAEELVLGSCDCLPYEDDSFDLVIAIATIHNLDESGVRSSLREIMRVSKSAAYIKVNGYRTEGERRRIEQWNLVAKTSLSVESWKALFREEGYTGDYSFFVP